MKADYFLRMQHIIPKRIVLRFNERYALEEAAIIGRFFVLFGTKPADDFYSHLCAPNLSSKMYIVLDLHCKTVPTVDLRTIEYKVFMMKKGDELYVVLSFKEIVADHRISHFKQLDDSACEYARQRCYALSWGTDRNYPEELDGVRLAQIGHSPGRFMS